MAKKEVSTDNEVLDQIQPSKEWHTWTLGTGDSKREYIQKPLGYMKKMQLFSLTGATIRQALATGGDGALSDILGGTGSLQERGKQLTSQDFRDTESFISLVASLATWAPEFLEQAYCIVLNVPLNEREWARSMMDQNHEDGGFSDEDGFQIINVFIEQNWQAILDFFGVHLKSVIQTVQDQQKKTTSETETDLDTDTE